MGVKTRLPRGSARLGRSRPCYRRLRVSASVQGIEVSSADDQGIAQVGPGEDS